MISAIQMPFAVIFLLAELGATRLWYAAPLIVSVSLVCAATRHEQMNPILIHALRFGVWIVVFMAIVLGVIQGLSWLQ
ncbi:MAG TPA: hypothetical protein VFW73_08170 [Lacipirellulaceae bacterium]|nr:hypothetical protein [Lacipirellulaceae bacterium]